MITPAPRDLRQALRVILKTLVVTVITVVSLALGIAACTTIFSLVHSFLLRPLPYPDADRLMMVWENPLARADDSAPVAPANYFDWRQQAGSFESLIAASFDAANLTGIDRPAGAPSGATKGAAEKHPWRWSKRPCGRTASARRRTSLAARSSMTASTTPWSG